MNDFTIETCKDMTKKLTIKVSKVMKQKQNRKNNKTKSNRDTSILQQRIV